jgi:hypothetical protein
MLTMISDGATNLTTGTGRVSAQGDLTFGGGQISFLRGATIIASHGIALTTNNSAALVGETPCSGYSHIETPAAGTYTYKMQARALANFAGANPRVNVTTCKLVAYEL